MLYRYLVHFGTICIWGLFSLYFGIAIRGIWGTRSRWRDPEVAGGGVTGFLSAGIKTGTNEPIWIIALGIFLFLEFVMLIDHAIARCTSGRHTPP